MLWFEDKLGYVSYGLMAMILSTDGMRGCIWGNIAPSDCKANNAIREMADADTSHRRKVFIFIIISGF